MCCDELSFAYTEWNGSKKVRDVSGDIHGRPYVTGLGEG